MMLGRVVVFHHGPLGDSQEKLAMALLFLPKDRITRDVGRENAC